MFPQVASYLSQFGKVRVLCPDEFREDITLVVLYSDMDIDSTSFSAYTGNVPYPTIRGVDPVLDVFVKDMLPLYMERGIPVMGIQTGALILNSLGRGKTVFNYTNTFDLFDAEVKVPLIKERSISLFNCKFTQLMKNTPSKYTPVLTSGDHTIAFVGKTAGGVLYNPLLHDDKELSSSIIRNLLGNLPVNTTTNDPRPNPPTTGVEIFV